MTTKPKKRIRTIFLGTPDFGAESLRALLSDDFLAVVAVISQPDKAVGRKQIITPPAIKALAEKYGLPVYQPEKIRTEVELIKKLNPELIVVVAYGQIIPPAILAIPKYGCLNVHGSLLPKYRGAACLAAAILNGDKFGGITIMKMDSGLDTGPIIRQKRIKIDPEETLESWHDKLANLGAKLLVPTIKKYIAGKIEPQAQSEDGVSYVKTLSKEDGHIDWTQSAKSIERRIRALNPWPGAFGYISDGKLGLNQVRFKILAARPKPLTINSHRSGEIFSHNSALAVQCGQNALVVIKLQLEGKKVMEVDEFLRGNHSIVGLILS